MVSFTASARAAILASVLLPRHILAVPQSSSPALVPRIWNGKKYGCKCYIGDSCWPAEPAWTHLNKTLDGNLVVDIPPGAPCHDEFNGPLGTVKTYDAAKCAEVTSNFASEDWTVSLPAAALWTFFTNETCRPTLNRKDVCTLGYYPIYVIMAKTTSHIKAGIDFARANNLRLIVRNTGHDFLGRSTGFGSLVINTHSFKDYTFHKSYRGPGNYSGPCVEVGAGVQGREFLRVGHERTPPVVVVTGECPTVGIAGGLVGGGGHGPWTTLKGFASDNALEFHVITADGVVRKANAEENPDLYWALKGGGPGAFAVILSVTYAVFEDVRSAGAILNINRTHTTDTQLWWKGVTAFHGYANHFVDSGLYVYWELAELSLHIQPFVAIGQSASDLREILKPLLDDLDRLGLEYSFSIKEFSTFFDLYIDMFEDEGAGGTAITGGWMFSHDDVAKNNEGIIGSFQNALANGAFIVGHLWDAGHSPTITESAINPRFKQSSDFAIVALPVAVNASLGEKAAAQELLTSNIDLELQKAGPCGANYVNEADPFQDNWQEHFWGTNYPKLLEIKKKWDPDTLFYYVSTPGTEDWEQIEHNTRLCKKL